MNTEYSEVTLVEQLTIEVSRSTGEPAVFGHTPDGRYVIVVYVEIDQDSVYPVTAYEVPESTR